MSKSRKANKKTKRFYRRSKQIDNQKDFFDDSFPEISNFSIDMEFPDKIIIFVDGDQRVPLDLDDVFSGEVPIHYIVIVGPQWNNNFIMRPYISYYRTNNFMKDSADLVITMLISKYVVSYDGTFFYILSDDTFAESVVNNLLNDNIEGVVLKRHQNLIVDFITNYDYNYTEEYEFFRQEIFKYEKEYDEYFLNNFMVAESIKNIPNGITRKLIANTLPCNEKGKLYSKLSIYNDLLDLKTYLTDLHLKKGLPIHIKEINISDDILKTFYVSKSVHFFQTECIQKYLHIKNYGDYLYPLYRSDEYIELSMRSYLLQWISDGYTLLDFMKLVGNRNKISKHKISEWLRNERKDYYPAIVAVSELIRIK